jgi:hypothetical protein
MPIASIVSSVQVGKSSYGWLLHLYAGNSISFPTFFFQVNASAPCSLGLGRAIKDDIPATRHGTLAETGS